MLKPMPWAEADVLYMYSLNEKEELLMIYCRVLSD